MNNQERGYREHICPECFSYMLDQTPFHGWLKCPTCAYTLKRMTQDKLVPNTKKTEKKKETKS